MKRTYIVIGGWFFVSFGAILLLFNGYLAIFPTRVRPHMEWILGALLTAILGLILVFRREKNGGPQQET